MELISDSRTLIEQIVDSYKLDKISANSKHWQYRWPITLTYEEFVTAISAGCDVILYERLHEGPFIIDKNNEPILRKLYLYSTKDEKFNEGGYDRRKGILLAGKYGCGKSLIMESWCRLLNKLSKTFVPTENGENKRPGASSIKFVKSFILFDLLKEPNAGYATWNLCIDEFGREKKDGKIYGDLIQPIKELINLRYDNGALTHGTTNFKMETLCSDEFYGPMIGDRLKQMFNFIELPGESRRK